MKPQNKPIRVPIMPKASYYILSDSDEDSRMRFACRLCEKILAQQLSVFILTHSESSAKRLDQLLWSFRPDSFVPHQLLGQMPAAPIEIGHGDQLPSHRQVFLNLAGELPDSALTFERLVEVVIQQEEILAATRSNFQRCKSAGYEMQTQKTPASR
ncbi:DNA polymerase III subunit chi [Nitrincola alkalilacustris]|uniref:DNA polymerase III subunit chi n=1 Tax=Nitrincola alkalilacustris TaxID=1571224 RepID=UPI001F1022B6|nr:DNA polymerase III subunit chi [Nitrincola alkalilacustris]